MSRPKDLGTAVETAVVRYAVQAGFPEAERRALAGSKDVGDVRLCRRPTTAIVECKRAMGVHGVSLFPWIEETIDEVANDPFAGIGLLVVKTRGVGDRSVGRWFTACPMQSWWPLSAHLQLQGSWSPKNLNPAGGLVDQVTSVRSGMADPSGWFSAGFQRLEIRRQGWQISRTGDSCVVGPLWWFLLGLRSLGYGEPLPEVSELHRLYEEAGS